MRWLLVTLVLVAIACDIGAGVAVNEIAQSGSHWALEAFTALCVSLVAAVVTALALPAAVLLFRMSTQHRLSTAGEHAGEPDR